MRCMWERKKGRRCHGKECEKDTWRQEGARVLAKWLVLTSACRGRPQVGFLWRAETDRANFMNNILSDHHIICSCPVLCTMKGTSSLQDDDIWTERTMHSKHIQMNSDGHAPIHTCCIIHGEMICKWISSTLIRCFVKINFSYFSTRILKKKKNYKKIKLENVVSFFFADILFRIMIKSFKTMRRAVGPSLRLKTN